MNRLYPVTEFYFDISDIPESWNLLKNKYEFKSLNNKTIDDFKRIYIECQSLTYGDQKYWEELCKADPDKITKTYIEEDDCLIHNICKIVYHNNQVLGLYLCAEDSDEKGIGAIEMIGIIPSERAKVYGLDLYKLVILDLYDYGFKKYIGGTAINNEPMIKLFNKVSEEIKLIKTEQVK